MRLLCNCVGDMMRVFVGLFMCDNMCVRAYVNTAMCVYVCGG